MRRLILAFLFGLIPLSGFAMPQPVQLGIANLPQETGVWCWAAVAQQIIAHSRGQAHTPQQCALVAVANGAHPHACCGTYNPACVRTGSLPQIAGLIQMFGGRSSQYALPADASALYRTLSNGSPVILHVSTGMMTSHVVVVTGMHYQPMPWGGVEPMLHINDPLAHYTQPVPFSQILPIWKDALVVL